MDLQVFDIFGIGIGLRYLNKQEYQSSFGAVITVIISALICFQIVIVGRELYEKKKPDVIFAERYVALPERFNIKRDTFNFAFGAQFPKNYTHFIDETIYTIDATMTQMIKKYNEKTKIYDQIWNDFPVKVHPCSNNDFEVKESLDYFNNLSGVTNMYCIDYDSQDIYMEGNFDQDSYGVLQLTFKLCDKKTNKNCRDEKEIKQILTNSFVAYYANDVIINPKNYDPFQIISRDYFWNASPLATKDIQMYYRNAYVESDKGIFFEEKSFERSTTFSFANEQIIFGEDSYYFKLQIRFEKSKESIYHRKYKKLDSVLAEIGGIAKALIIIGFFFCMPINQLRLHQQLSNSLFFFGKKQKQSESNQQTIDGQKLVQIIENSQHENRLKNTQSNTNFSMPVNTKSLNNVQKDTCIKKISPNISHSLYNADAPPLSSERGALFSPNQNNHSVNYFLSTTQNDKTKFGSNSNGVDITKQVSFEPAQRDDLSLQVNNNTHSHFQPQNSQKNGLNLLTLIKQSKQLRKISNSAKEQVRQRKLSQNQQNNQNKDQPKDSQNQEEGTLELTWSDYVKYYIWPFGRFAQKKKQIDYSIENIYKHLDMLYIVKKLLELEKLKQLLLDENQIRLIQFFPKPIIDVAELDSLKKESKNNEKSKIKLNSPQKQKQMRKSVNLLKEDEKFDEKEKTKQAFQAIRNILKKDRMTEIDKRVIEMLDEQILEKIGNNADYLEEFDQDVGDQEVESVVDQIHSDKQFYQHKLHENNFSNNNDQNYKNIEFVNDKNNPQFTPKSKDIDQEILSLDNSVSTSQKLDNQEEGHNIPLDQRNQMKTLTNPHQF